MLLPFDGVSKDIMFSGCPSATFVRSSIRLFVWTDLVTTISHDGLRNFNETYVE